LRNGFNLNQVIVEINKKDSAKEVTQINERNAIKKGFVFLQA
jgi:hypothetical protein